MTSQLLLPGGDPSALARTSPERRGIRRTKFFKSRRLPLSDSVIAALRAYLDARKHAGAPTTPDAALFWHRQAAGRYSRGMAESLLRRALRRAEIKPAPGRMGPRVHDLRHAFVVNRMLAWYRQGVNPQPHLLYLATYLGHKDINFDPGVPDRYPGTAAASQAKLVVKADRRIIRQAGVEDRRRF